MNNTMTNFQSEDGAEDAEMLMWSIIKYKH